MGESMIRVHGSRKHWIVKLCRVLGMRIIYWDDWKKVKFEWFVK